MDQIPDNLRVTTVTIHRYAGQLLWHEVMQAEVPDITEVVSAGAGIKGRQGSVWSSALQYYWALYSSLAQRHSRYCSDVLQCFAAVLAKFAPIQAE